MSDIIEFFDDLDTSTSISNGLAMYAMQNLSHACAYLIQCGYSEKEIGELAEHVTKKVREATEQIMVNLAKGQT